MAAILVINIDKSNKKLKTQNYFSRKSKVESRKSALTQNSKLKTQNLKLILLLLLLALISCGHKQEEASEDFKGVEVKVGNPEKRTMTQYLELSANTIYQKQEIIRATFQGYIQKALKMPGDIVNKGDELFIIKTKEASAVDSSSLTGGYSGIVIITAKLSGVLTELHYQTGDYVADGDQLALIVDPQSLKIMLSVPFQYTKYINQNEVYTYSLPDGKTHEAKVSRKIPSIDPASQTQSFILEPTVPTQIPTNLNLYFKIPVNIAKDAISLPKSAVLSDETQTNFWVMRLINDSIAVKVIIKKGIEAEGMVRIVTPELNLKDRFIIDGGYGMPDTTKILITK